MENNRNIILAIVLSMIVLFGWQFFVAGPQMERAQQQAQIAAEQQAQAEAALATPATTTTEAGTASWLPTALPPMPTAPPPLPRRSASP
jgi:YidC/Oxa1 family membrane protein insertase